MAVVASAQITHHRAILQKALLQKSLDRTLVSPVSPIGEGSDALSSEERESRLLASGWTTVDRALSGGFPRGECSEIVGSSSSGRTALLTTLLTEATRRGEIVALVDTLDRFDPRAAVEMAVPPQDPLDVPPEDKKHDKKPLDLSRMLWVRGTPLSPQAVGASSQARGARSQTRARPSLRGRVQVRSVSLVENGAESDEEPQLLSRVIDRALKSFGLIAQAGGFGVVALDLAEVPMTALRRLPFTTWFRLQRLIEGSQTVGILLAPEPIGRSARGVTVYLGGGYLGGGRLGGGEVTRVIWTGTNDCARVLTGFALQPQVQAARRLGDQLREVVSA